MTKRKKTSELSNESLLVVLNSRIVQLEQRVLELEQLQLSQKQQFLTMIEEIKMNADLIRVQNETSTAKSVNKMSFIDVTKLLMQLLQLMLTINEHYG